MKFINEKYLKYLPSKKFAAFMVIATVLVTIIYSIFFMSSGSEVFSTTGQEKQKNNIYQNQSITDLVNKDTDGDGIFDWEEKLWGTDPTKKVTFDNVSDSTYIANKKKELKIEQSIDETKLTETDKFAREFFSSYSAMKSSGQVNNDTINSFSNALGQKIVNPNLVDRYSESNVIIQTTNDSAARLKYYTEVKNLFKSYQSNGGIGNEIDIVSQGLAKDSTGANAYQYDKLLTIGNSYQNFAKKIMELNVPKSLVEYHLRIANSSNNTGISVINMQKISSDPIIGLSGLSEYKKYSESLVNAVSDLETFLSKQ